MARFRFLLVLVVVGCGDVTAPPNYIGSYHLSRVNGSVIPVGLPAGTSSCTTNVDNGRLDLSTGTFSLALITSLTTSAQCLLTTAILGLSGSVHANGQILDLKNEQPPQAVREEVRMRAELNGQDLKLTWLDDQYGVPGGTQFTFSRTPSSP